jgi:hypothetical protein
MMFVLDAVDIGSLEGTSHDAEMIVQGIKRSLGRENLTVTRRGRTIRVVSPHPTTISAIHNMIIQSPRMGPSAKLHTYQRSDERFLEVNWRPKVVDAVA